MAVDVTEIFTENLRQPPVRPIRAGKPNAALFDIIETNSRLPDFVRGDLSTQLAARRRGAKVLRDLFSRYGIAAVREAVDAAFAEGAARAEPGLVRLPRGRFPIAAQQDDGSHWNVAIEITDQSFKVDLRVGPDAPISPHDTSRDGALLVCQMLFKAFTDGERFANAGSSRPLRVRTRPALSLTLGRRHRMGYDFETRIRLFDLLWRVMAEAMPGSLPAGHFPTIFGMVIAGKHPITRVPIPCSNPKWADGAQRRTATEPALCFPQAMATRSTVTWKSPRRAKDWRS